MEDDDGTAPLPQVQKLLPPTSSFRHFGLQTQKCGLCKSEHSLPRDELLLKKTKFDYIISSLSPEFVTEVRYLTLKPPTENPYDKLKEQLTRRTAASEQRKLQQLFTAEELGDRKPTQLLRRMHNFWVIDQDWLMEHSYESFSYSDSLAMYEWY